MSDISFSIFELSKRQRVLAGAQGGRRLLASLIGQGVSAPDPTRCFLNFKRIDVATISFLREGVLGFRDYARSSMLNLYPIVSNAAPAVIEELAFYLDARADAMWVCETDSRHSLGQARLVGKLETVQDQTLRLVCRLGTVEVPTLAAQDSSVGATAWNNRLAALVAKGLVIERRNGKTKNFTPVCSEASRNGTTFDAQQVNRS